MEPSLTEPVAKRADQLVVGDRIPDEYLAFRFNQGPAEVVFVAHEHSATLPWIFVAYRYPNGQHDSMTVRPEAELQIFPADPTGLTYTRADDGEQPQPTAGRVPPHFESGRVMETLSDRPKVLFEHEERSAPAPSYLFGLDAGAMGQHSDGCEWPRVQCIGHASAV